MPRDIVRGMRASRIAVILAVLLGVGALVASLDWPASRERDIATRERAAEPAPLAPAPVARSDATGPAAVVAPLPSSLRDSEIDGSLAVDSAGHFIPTASALALFDYFLSATGEEPDAQLRARIVAEIERRLADPAATEAIAFLDLYLGYRAAAEQMALDERLAESADLERRLQWIRELRRQHFGAALASSLFGDEERATEVAIAQRRVATDASLTEREKQVEMDALEARLPAAERRARAASAAPRRLEEQEAALRERGGSDAELRALREELVGAEAAERLEERDRRRADWEGRLAEYRVARDAVLADAGLEPEAREAAIEGLLARRFDARERIRVRTLDSMEGPATR
jgi:lipase chaperone LimK